MPNTKKGKTNKVAGDKSRSVPYRANKRKPVKKLCSAIDVIDNRTTADMTPFS